jgi:hypothetical protein
MSLRTLSPLLVAASFAVAAPASAADTSYGIDASPVPGIQPEIEVRLGGQPHQPFLLTAAVPAFGLEAVRVSTGVLDEDGVHTTNLLLPASLVHTGVAFTGYFAERGGIGTAGPSALHADGDLCVVYDFNLDFAGAPKVAGEIVDTDWLWDEGFLVFAQTLGGGPKLAVLFDSTAPTGGDTDLVTPGYGSGQLKGVDYGMLVIVAENNLGGEDDIVDDPDDDAAGGVITFDFGASELFGVQICSMVLVDIDEADGAQVQCWLEGELVSQIDVPGLDDNSIQTLQFGSVCVDRVDVRLSGSGAVAEFSYIPDDKQCALPGS